MATNAKQAQGCWSERLKELVSKMTIQERASFFLKYVRAFKRSTAMKAQGINTKE